MIGSFQGDYRWLSNFWPSVVLLDGVEFPTVEHAYQAAKTLNPVARLAIQAQPSPGRAKRAAKMLALREDWHEIRLRVMEDLLRQKFRDPKMKALLIATDLEELVEGNTWGDRFWGVYGGEGENHLGKLLMKIRLDLKLGLDRFIRLV